MARKKKSKKGANPAMAMPSGPSRERIDSGIESAENGFIVRVSKETPGGKNSPGKYESKTFIAPTREHAIRISSGAIETMGRGSKGGKKKGGGKKRISTKR